jgi:hypothetical protein
MSTKSSFVFVILLVLTVNLHAATYFVRSGAAGNGTSWANAWGNLSSISWSSLNAGDTVCVAGGSYSGSISTGKSGANGNPITIKRALASDPTCGSGTSGWNAAYDAQVVTTGTISIAHNYVTIDGAVWNGISLTVPNPTSYYQAISADAATSNVTLRYIEANGPNAPGTTSPVAQHADHRSLDITYWTGSDWGAQTNWTLQYVNLHGACNNFVIYGAVNMVIEHSRFADSGTSDSTNCHPNVGNLGSNTSVTFRYNEIVNWQVEGLMFLSGGTGTGWYIYGNVWHDPMPGSYPRFIEAQESSQTAYVYNNTFANLYYLCASTSNGGTWSGSTMARNNLYYGNNFATCGISGEDYAASNATTGETHGQNGITSALFVNASAKTVAGYHLASATTAGQNLGSPYNIDYDGNSRSTWDRGAIEFDSSAASPQPPTSLNALVQ